MCNWLKLLQKSATFFKLLILSEHVRINKVYVSLLSQNGSKEEVSKIYHNLDLADLTDKHQKEILEPK